MGEPPAGTVAQRLPMATPPGRRTMPDVPTRGTGRPGMQAPAASTPVGPGAAAATPPAPRTLPVLTVSRLASGAGRRPTPDRAGHDHGGSSRGAAPVGPLAGAGRAASPARARTTVPTLGGRPLRPSATAQRDAAGYVGMRPGPGSSITPSPALPAPVAARWSTGGELPATVEGLPPAPAGGEPVSLQRLAASPGSGAGIDATAPSANAPREIVFPPRDSLATATGGATGLSAFAGAASLQRSTGGTEPALPGFAASPASSSSQPPAMTLHHAAAPAPTGSAAASTPAPFMQRLVADPAPASASVVQTSRPAAAGALPGIVATPVVQRIDGAAPPAPGAAGGHTDTELDELARAIFGRIRTHLRSEVIHEREAKGLSFDAF